MGKISPQLWWPPQVLLSATVKYEAVIKGIKDSLSMTKNEHSKKKNFSQQKVAQKGRFCNQVHLKSKTKISSGLVFPKTKRFVSSWPFLFSWGEFNSEPRVLCHGPRLLCFIGQAQVEFNSSQPKLLFQTTQQVIILHTDAHTASSAAANWKKGLTSCLVELGLIPSGISGTKCGTIQQ